MTERAWILAEFKTPEAMLAGVRRARALGFHRLDTHSPYAVPGAAEALGLRASPIPIVVLIFALAGAALAYGFQWWANAVSYPINVGGRPLHSPPTNIPITFEVAVLLGSLSAFLAFFALRGYPRHHHPIFESEAFRSATVDRFWVSIASDQAEVDEPRLRAALGALGATRLERVTDEPAAGAVH